MLKRILVLCAISSFIWGNLFAQLPYAKMINLSNEELKEKNFKYDSNKNLFSMSKSLFKFYSIIIL